MIFVTPLQWIKKKLRKRVNHQSSISVVNNKLNQELENDLSISVVDQVDQVLDNQASIAIVDNFDQKSNNQSCISALNNINIRVVGDRYSGKTVYMASLAYWPNVNSESPLQSVTSFGDQETSQELFNCAQNILKEGLKLNPKNIDDFCVDQIKDYGLKISLKNYFSEKLSQNRSDFIEFTINCKDYSGEFFRDVIYKSNDPFLKDYLEDFQLADGLLLLVDGTSYRKDQQYAKGLEKFLLYLNQTKLHNPKRRIAFVLNKCELSELWMSRHQPRELVAKRFPQMMATLENWSDQGLGEVEYFTASAFGTLGNDYYQPNTKILAQAHQGTFYMIRHLEKWRPFGLVSPIYWLCTGERHEALDQD
ncbi:hypothetical protein PCC8801_0570 [Rippkaea orientalis PCC 8801]|uniref:Uncharacterized protein n=1 Tax=Rippkaea orientalis (strain PCC 8801 / RF-1) TaxID=41431 RepID=B7JVT9_RIPO1|nr:hypothetical protein [Rippkaea orientalis]ACK64660.1 hypothetical protein PCC8801_0570 [Rippkaea orientalis PCC 8801]